MKKVKAIEYENNTCKKCMIHYIMLTMVFIIIEILNILNEKSTIEILIRKLYNIFPRLWHKPSL